MTELIHARQEADDARKSAEAALAEVRATHMQMVQMEKMRAVGELAQGIAHDINNALMAVIGYTDLAEEDLREPDALAKHLTYIRKAAEGRFLHDAAAQPLRAAGYCHARRRDGLE